MQNSQFLEAAYKFIDQYMDQLLTFFHKSFVEIKKWREHPQLMKQLYNEKINAKSTLKQKVKHK